MSSIVGGVVPAMMVVDALDESKRPYVSETNTWFGISAAPTNPALGDVNELYAHYLSIGLRWVQDRLADKPLQAGQLFSPDPEKLWFYTASFLLAFTLLRLFSKLLVWFLPLLLAFVADIACFSVDLLASRRSRIHLFAFISASYSVGLRVLDSSFYPIYIFHKTFFETAPYDSIESLPVRITSFIALSPLYLIITANMMVSPLIPRQAISVLLGTIKRVFRAGSAVEDVEKGHEAYAGNAGAPEGYLRVPGAWGVDKLFQEHQVKEAIFTRVKNEWESRAATREDELGRREDELRRREDELRAREEKLEVLEDTLGKEREEIDALSKDLAPKLELEEVLASTRKQLDESRSELQKKGQLLGAAGSKLAEGHRRSEAGKKKAAEADARLRELSDEVRQLKGDLQKAEAALAGADSAEKRLAHTEQAAKVAELKALSAAGGGVISQLSQAKSGLREVEGAVGRLKRLVMESRGYGGGVVA
jgi:signal transduction histidine kinase